LAVTAVCFFIRFHLDHFELLCFDWPSFFLSPVRASSIMNLIRSYPNFSASRLALNARACECDCNKRFTTARNSRTLHMHRLRLDGVHCNRVPPLLQRCGLGAARLGGAGNALIEESGFKPGSSLTYASAIGLLHKSGISRSLILWAGSRDACRARGVLAP